MPSVRWGWNLLVESWNAFEEPSESSVTGCSPTSSRTPHAPFRASAKLALAAWTRGESTPYRRCMALTLRSIVKDHV